MLKTSPRLDTLLDSILRESAYDAPEFFAPRDIVEYALDIVDDEELDSLIGNYGYDAVVDYIAQRVN